MVLVGYALILQLTGSILLDYDIVSSVSGISDNPDEIVRRIENLKQRLNDKKELLEVTQSRKKFSQGTFRELAQWFKSSLVHMETSNSAADNHTRYTVTYSGKITNLLNLLNRFENGYLINIEKVVLHPDNSDGSQVRMTMVLSTL